MQTILGPNGVIGYELAKILRRDYTTNIRLVSRNPERIHPTDELLSADLKVAEQARQAVAGSEVVYLTIGLPYDSAVWECDWPPIMTNMIDACKKEGCKLVYFDNTYMYGRSDQAITEDQPFAPSGRKAKVKAAMAQQLLAAMSEGRVEALIARAPEFYGPGRTKSITNGVLFNNIKKGKKLKVLLMDDTLRTLIYTPDAAAATALLGNTPDCYGQTWHLPCDDDRMTYQGWIKHAELLLGKSLPYTVLSKPMLKAAALVNPNMRETLELLPRYEVDNFFDSSKFKQRFPNFETTTYREGIAEMLRDQGVQPSL